MKLKKKLRLEDLQVTTFDVDGTGGVHAASYSGVAHTCIGLQCGLSETGGCGDPYGPQCVTQQAGGSDPCDTGPDYYC